MEVYKSPSLLLSRLNPQLFILNSKFVFRSLSNLYICTDYSPPSNNKLDKSKLSLTLCREQYCLTPHPITLAPV